MTVYLVKVEKGDEDIEGSVVYVAEDETEAIEWARKVRQHEYDTIMVDAWEVGAGRTYACTEIFYADATGEHPRGS